MKWKQTLSEVGLTEETISHGLRKKIKDYYEVQNGIKNFEESMSNPELDEDQISDMQDALEQMNDSLDEADDQLVKAILVFHKNKDKYAEMSKHLSKGRPKKNASTENKDNNTQKTDNQANNNPQQTPQPVSNPDGSTEPKKKNPWGFVFLALAVGVISLGAVNMFKNND